MKIIMKRVVQVAVLSAFLMPVSQADDCTENAEDQSEMNACIQMDYMAAEAELKRHSEGILQRVDGDANTQSLFRDAEKTWIAFRDAECTFSASKDINSSAYQMLYSICLTDLTQKRSEQLLQYLNCEEGDQNCPVPMPDLLK